MNRESKKRKSSAVHFLTENGVFRFKLTEPFSAKDFEDTWAIILTVNRYSDTLDVEVLKQQKKIAAAA